MIASVVVSNLMYLVGAVILAVVLSLMVVLRHRKPKSVEANMASFNRGLRALAPDPPNQGPSGRSNGKRRPGARSSEKRSGGAHSRARKGPSGSSSGARDVNALDGPGSIPGPTREAETG